MSFKLCLFLCVLSFTPFLVSALDDAQAVSTSTLLDNSTVENNNSTSGNKTIEDSAWRKFFRDENMNVYIPMAVCPLVLLIVLIILKKLFPEQIPPSPYKKNVQCKLETPNAAGPGTDSVELNPSRAAPQPTEETTPP